jgi:hypothetical protein
MVGAATLSPELLGLSPKDRDGGAASRGLPRVVVHPEGHFLQLENGAPFFWLGDTAWQLVHDLTREECAYYLRTRARQGYTVVQTVILSEFDGLNQPNAFGERPLLSNDPGRPNAAYFDRVTEIVDQAAAEGLYVALVPAWGDKLTAPWGVGPRIFTGDNLPAARAYGHYLGNLLSGRTNVIWLLGGDRPAQVLGSSNDYFSKAAADAGFGATPNWTPIWREMAAGLGDGGGRSPLVVYHPQAGEMSSSVLLPHERWLSVNGMQSGHGGGHDVPVWDWIARDFALEPKKPTLDLEPNYEDHPYNPWPRWDPATGYFRDHDVRKQTYRSVFAGGCGVTYGHHAVWQFAGPRKEVINHADRDWIDALWRPAGRQMQFLRRLVESRPFFSRIPDPALVEGANPPGGRHILATRDRSGAFAFVYFPECDQEASLDLGRLSGTTLRAWWYDPRAGVGTLVGDIRGKEIRPFRSPAYGPDWVLVLDDRSSGFAPPGLSAASS